MLNFVFVVVNSFCKENVDKKNMRIQLRVLFMIACVTIKRIKFYQ